MTDIATNEPLELRAGMSWAWRREDLSADYPAPTWTLTYFFKNASANFSFAAVASGTMFAIARTPATTSQHPPGAYDWVAVVTDGINKYQVDSGRLVVLPDFTGSANIDGRSHARKVLAAIEALLEGRASKDQQEFTLSSGVSLKRTPLPELLKLRQVYANAVAAEDAAERLANGLGGKAKIQVRI